MRIWCFTVRSKLRYCCALSWSRPNALQCSCVISKAPSFDSLSLAFFDRHRLIYPYSTS